MPHPRTESKYDVLHGDAMLLDALIAHLQELRAEHGNIPVYATYRTGSSEPPWPVYGADVIDGTAPGVDEDGPVLELWSR